MSVPLLTRIFITWVLFLPVPVLNGFLRETWYAAIVGITAAHQIGSVLLSVVFLLYAYISLRHHASALQTTQLLLIGAVWLALTLAFEFNIGVIEGASLDRMLADYKIWEGRIWPLVLLVVFLSPLIVRRIVSREQTASL